MADTGRLSLLDKPYGNFNMVTLPIPSPQGGDVLVKQELTGICGTDVHIYQGWLPGIRYPIVLGHEIFGRIHSMGEDVKEDYTGRPVKTGDHVYIAPGISCGKCYFCSILREPTLCTNIVAYGFNPHNEGKPSFSGGYADYIYMNIPGSSFLRLDIKPEVAVFLEPLAIGIHVADRGMVRAGDTVVIQGAGAIGLASLVASAAKGANKTIMIGAPQSRLDLASELGADIVINIEKVKGTKERVDMVLKETPGGYGADVAIECVGEPSAITEGLRMARRGGSYIVPGHYTDAGDVKINPYADIVNKEVNIKGIWGCHIDHLVRARPILESGKFKLEEVVSHKVPLTEVKKAIEALLGDYRLNGEEVRKIAVSSEVDEIV